MKLFVPLCILVFSSTISVTSKANLPISSMEVKPCTMRSECPARVNSDSIVVKKTMNRRSHKVALYPDTEQKVLFFNVRGFTGKVYQLFVFDMQGNIVKQAEIRNKQTTLIKNIERGTYLFEVFSNDDRIGEGQIAVL